MAFPIQRLRRLRQHEAFRRMVRETRLAPSDFIYPLFVVEGRERREEINSLHGEFRISVEHLIKEERVSVGMGVTAINHIVRPSR